MSIYNKDNSKLNDIVQENLKLTKDLEVINNNKKTNSNICDFKSIFIQNKIKKLNSKIKNIIMGKPNNDNNIA